MIDLARSWRMTALAVFAVAAGLTAAQAQPTPPRRVQLPPGALHEVFQPVGNGTTFAAPQDVTSPFGLQIMGGSAIVHTSNFSSAGVLEVGNPSIVFQFPITPDVNGYLATPGGLHFAYKSIGWTGAVALEACLTPAEVPAWSGATAVAPRPDDASTCPPEDDLVHVKIVQRAWYQVATAHVDEYVVQNAGFVNVPTNVPVNLQQIVAPMRVHMNGYELFYTAAHTGPNDFNAACPQNVCNGKQDLRTSPFKVVVLPAALIQLKVLPQSIIYLPPGNNSFASYKVSATFTTVVTAGAVNQVDNSQSNDEWMEDINQTTGTATIAKIFNLGYSSSDDTRWDNKTVVKTGQSLEHDLQGQNSQQIIVTRQVKSTAVNVPGAAGTIANEPFWSDQVVMLIHPQFAFWDFYGKTTLQLIAASSAGSALPDDIMIPISELDACAQGQAPFQTGFPITPASGKPDVLTATDCKALAAIDPFYERGQSADPGGRGTLFAPTQPYGTPTSGPGSPGLIDLQHIDSQQITVTNQGVQTFASTVEDIVATTQSQGLKLGISSGSLVPGLSLGLQQDITLKQGSNTDTAQTMTLTFKNSSATTSRVDVTVEGSISDTVNRGYPPMVAVYLDNVYGGLMFVDPTAPAVPCTPQPICTVRTQGVTQIRARQ
jgi:hypothetical protein